MEGKFDQSYLKLALDLCEGHDIRPIDNLLEKGLSDCRPLERISLTTKAIDELFEMNRWDAAITHLYGNNNLQQFYDGDQETLESKIVSDTPKTLLEFNKHWPPHDRREYETLKTVNKGNILYRVAMESEGIDTETAIGLIDMAHYDGDLPKEKYNKGINKFAENFVDTDPQRAAELFDRTGNKKRIEEIYNALLKDFSLDNFRMYCGLLERLPGDGKKEEKLTALVHRAINSEDMEAKAKSLYTYLRSHSISMSEDDKSKLFGLALPQLEAKEVHDYDKLAWAKLVWQENPFAAYNIFTTSRDRYDGPEKLACAQLCFEQMHSTDSTVKGSVCVSRPHIMGFKDKLDPNDIKLQTAVAKNLDNYSKLSKIIETHAKSGDYEKAYKLHLSTRMPIDDSFLDSVVDPLIDANIAELEAGQDGWFGWVDREDIRSPQRIYNKIMGNHPNPAYHLAKRLWDDEKLDEVRNAIIKVNKDNPFAAMKFFQEQNDKDGYEKAVEDLLLSKSEYEGITREQVDFLTGGVKST